jgi:hypothetical protein
MIEEAISSSMHSLARQDRQRWAGMSKDQRVAEASQHAIRSVEDAALRKEMLATNQILKTEETNTRIKQAAELDKLTRSRALIRDIEHTDSYVHAIRNESISGLADLIDAAESTDGTGILRNMAMKIWDLDNPAITADIVREVFSNASGKTGNLLAKKGAEAWLSTIENLRLRFNAAGGDVGKVSYGYLSQIHDAVKVGGETAQAWAMKVLPLLNREQYVNADGSLMTDVQLSAMLESAHETIATGGQNKSEPGTFKGIGAKANQGRDARVIHFKDGDAWLSYMQEFGSGSLYDAMLGHVGAMARNIGLVERYGPNPEMQFRLQNDIAEMSDGRGTYRNRAGGNTPKAYWDMLTGATGTPENPVIAKAFQDARNVQTAAKLGGAVITSLTDISTVAATLHYNRLPYFEMLRSVGRQFDSDHRDFLTSHGLIAEHLTTSLNRWTGDNLTHSLTGRVASSVMKLSFMNAWTDALRGAFSDTMMQGFAKKTGTAWHELDEWDRYLMQRKGINEADWNVITQAIPTDRNGLRYLTKESITATGHEQSVQAANKWMAFVADDAQYAVLNPDMATRAIVTAGGMPAGTISGEAARTMMQFRSFPTAMITRHWRRIFETPQGLEGAPLGYGANTEAGATLNRVALLAGLSVSGMMLGAVVLQSKSMLAGKDPLDMTEQGFWGRALTQGGGLGYFGDFLLKDPTEQRGNNFEQAAGAAFGPAAGAIAGLGGDLLITNAWQAYQGKETQMAGESLRWLNAQLPYASLWQIRGIWEHWFIHNAQEAVNPGYLARMQQRAMRDYGQDYFWQPGEIMPDRAPDLATSIGE